MNPFKLTPSLLLVAAAAVLFAIAVYHAEPREPKNVTVRPLPRPLRLHGLDPGGEVHG
jgi:hypothetical protein